MGIQVPILQITSLITGVEVSFFFIAGYFLKKAPPYVLFINAGGLGELYAP